MNSLEALKADTWREFGLFRWHYLIKGLFRHRTYRVLISTRLCQYAAQFRGLFRVLVPFFKLFNRISTQLAAMDLPWRTEIGGGLALPHGWGIVINAEARIGKNVTIFHGVTIGRRDFISPEGKRVIQCPVIEDEVWIGPNAIIVGGITIGRGSRIAGGAFVTEDIPPYSVVSGNPAIIVKENCIPDVMNPYPH